MTDSNGIAVGIDLGTTRSVVAYLDTTGRPTTVKNLEGDATTPSVVFFDRDSVVVGREAVKVAEFEPDRVAQFAKRHLGKEDFSIEVANRRFPPEVLQALVLQKLKADAQQHLGDVRKCVVTVPAYFNEPRRKATQDAGRLAGLDVVDIINEPTAAALAFGVQQGFVNADGRSDQLETVLVYDLGGGTFDVTLMEIEGDDYRAIGTAGDVYLGGIDWDQRIADYIAEQFLEQFGTDPREDPTQRLRLLTEAEDAKKSLSQRDEILIRFAMDGHRGQVPFNRAQFESLCGDLIDRTMFTTRRVLREADRSWKDLSRLILVGGSSRMPMVQNALEAESGLTVDRSLSADESVAHGAAIYAGIVLNAGTSTASRISVTNVNSHDLGILGLDSTSGQPRRSVMIPRNTRLPAKVAKQFRTSRPSQPSVAVNVIEGGDDKGQHAAAIGKCVVRDLPSDLPKSTPVQVIFNYTQDGRLKIVAQLPSINRKAALTIERGSGLTEEELQLWQQRIEAGIIQSTEEIAEPTEVSTNGVKLSSAPEVANVGELTPTDIAVPDVAGEPDFSNAEMFTASEEGESFSMADLDVSEPESELTAIPEVPDISAVPVFDSPAESIPEQTQTAKTKQPATGKQSAPKKGGWKSRRKQVRAGDE